MPFKAIEIKKIQILSNNTSLEFLDKFCPNLPQWGISRGILPHVQTGLTNWNPDNNLSLPGSTNWNPDNCPGKGGIRPVLF